ncbi:MAG: hypothetical protein WA549_07155 [Thermoplasmata archaeon]
MTERRFANVVVGLESLYLPPVREGELSFRLKAHVGFVMDALGYDGAQVGREVMAAYRIRSAHVHGAHLTVKMRKKAELEFGDIKVLLRRVTNYLRISIILAMTNPDSKETFLADLDLGLVSAKKAEEIRLKVAALGTRIPRG